MISALPLSPAFSRGRVARPKTDSNADTLPDNVWVGNIGEIRQAVPDFVSEQHMHVARLLFGRTRPINVYWYQCDADTSLVHKAIWIVAEKLRSSGVSLEHYFCH